MKKLAYLTEASIMVAGLAGLLFLSTLIGYALGDIFPFLLPIPLGIYALRHSATKTIIPAAAISIISFFIFNFVYCLTFIVPGAVIGILYGFLLSFRIKEKYRLIFLFIANLITGLLTTYLLSEILYGISMQEDIALLVSGIFSLFTPGQISENTIEIINALAISLVPTLIIVYSLMSAFITDMGTRLLVSRIMKEVRFAPTRPWKWKLPWQFAVSFLLLALLATYLLPYWVDMLLWQRVLLVIVINVAAILGFAFMGQGLIVAGHYSRNHNKMWVYWIYALSFLFFPVLPLFTGVWDSLKMMTYSKKN